MPKLDTPAVLAALPTIKSETAWLSTTDIAQRLSNRGHDSVHVKTVIRRLQALEDEGLVISRSVGRARQWQRKEGASGLSKGFMSMDEALALQILRRFASHQLPEQVMSYLNGLFDAAQNRLDHPNEKREGRYAVWSQKVAVTAGVYQLRRPAIKQTVFQCVSDALFMERMLAFHYRRPDLNGKCRPYTVMPLGMVEAANGLLYLVARTMSSKGLVPEPSRYRLDRMDSAELAADEFDYPRDFNLATYMNDERKMDFFTEEKTSVTLRANQEAGQRLLETPLTKDQIVTHHRDGGMTIRATVVLSLRFREWLITQGANVEVIAPRKLRSTIMNEVQAMYMRYFAPGSGIAESAGG